MKKRLVLFGLIVTLLPLSLYSQKWRKLMNDENVDFYTIQNEFDNYWEGKKILKGKGWKPFKRWEDFWEPRVYPTGQFPSMNITQVEADKFNQVKPGRRNQAVNIGNWSSMGPSSMGVISYNPGIGRVSTVAVDPNNSQIIYAGVPAGGLWKSTDGGATYNTYTDDLSVLGVAGVAVHPTNSSIVYIATGDGDAISTYSIGVLKSTDGGVTFNTTGLNWNIYQGRTNYKIVIHPTQPDTVLLASSNGLWRSFNGGTSWLRVISDVVFDIEFNSADPSIIYASGYEFYKSTNGGSSFSTITSGLPSSFDVNRMQIAVTDINSNYVYLVASDYATDGLYGVYRSTDGGTTFSTRATSPNILGYQTDGSDVGGQGFYDLTIAVNPTNENEVYVGGINLWKSTDGGANWNALTYWVYGSGWPYVHADQHALEFFGSTLFAGCDGGLFKSDDFGTSWTDISDGIECTQFYRMGSSATDENVMIGGSQDNGSSMYINGVWTHIKGGDGMECAVDPTNSNILYATSQFGNLGISTNQGSWFTNISPASNGAWITPFMLNPQNPATIYAGYADVYKSMNKGTSWSVLTSMALTDDIRTLAVAPSDSNYIYTASYYELFGSTNEGGNWTNISSGLPFSSATLSYIAVDPNDAQRVWVTFSGYSTGNKVFKSENAGASWSNVSGSLPNIPANCIVYEDGSNDGIYVGTDVGIYYQDNSTGGWIEFKTGLPNVIVRELEIFYPTEKIRAATYGRGIWESNLYSTLQAPPTAGFTVNDSTLCQSSIVQFTDQSGGSATSWSWSLPGGTPSSSTLQNPDVTYNSAGSYDVTLIVSDGSKNDTLLKSNYIVVNDVGSVALGTSGNLYTIIGNEKVAVAANSDLNTVVFIHRNDPNRFGGNSGHFRYDVSTDGGQNWTTNVGRLNPSNNNTTLGGRYPQIVIHNPTANTNPSNAYMGYLGTYHDGNNWMGTVTGVCRLDNDTTTITEKYTPQSNGHTSMGSGLCNGAQDVFWSINFTVNGDFTVGTQYNNLLINKGVYNSGTNDIDWTYDSLLITHDITYDGNTRADAWNMAFDPTGQYGWIVYTGEITNNGEKTYEPIFFNSSDNGNTWNGPTTLNPRFFANIMASLSPNGPDTATCAWETDIVVDINGDPHLGVLVGTAANYSIYNTLNMYLVDLTYSWTDDKWYSIILDTIETFRNNATVSTYHDSRPQMALSPSGDKVFFTWVDSDSALTAGANSLPDLFGKGYDVNTKLATPTFNFTQGNCAWDTKALFSSSANNAFKSGSTYQVHTVITELNTAGDELDTTYFHYLDNITFDDADFTESLSTSPYEDKIIAQFSTADTSICAPDSVTFSNKSQNSPSSWLWLLPGATPSSSTVQNPTVEYSVNGTYDVTLIATRGADIDTLIKSNYISVRTTNSQPIGTSTNLYSTITNQANVIAANNDLNTIVFVHRNNTNLFGGNSGQYRYDISTDGGLNWTTEIGEINSTADGATVFGRYPQAAIHNPAANSVPDSAYLVYTSTYHDGATWQGMNTGVAKLNNDTSTFTSQEVIQRNGGIYTNTGFCNGAQDEFWGVNFGYNKTTGAVMDLIVSNGVFNTSTRDIDWTYDSIAVAHNVLYDGVGKFSAYNIAFDPTGQYGWVAYSGHVKTDTNWVLQPVFYKTVDFGTSWTGPDTLDLSYFPNAYIGMDLLGTGVPTTSFESDLIVDVNGDPHYGVIIGPGINYSIQSTLDMMMMDIHYNSADGEWYSIFLDSIKALRWQVTTNVIQDNRPQMSLSSTGEQVFFTWVDSDPFMTGGDNSLPDLYGIGYDINTRKGTPVVSFTKDDCNWENRALFPAISTNALKQVSTHIIPTVMARMNAAGNELDTTYYDYFENVQFDDADFTETLNISKYSTLPVADFRSFDTTLCKGDTISFLDRSLSKPLGWSWSFPGATPSSSTLRDPQGIAYTTAGNFDVILITTNAVGQDTATFTNYITVGEVPSINTVTTVDISCFGSNDGSINIDFSGGTSPFTFTWSNGDSVQNLSGLGQDTLSLSIIDSFGCGTAVTDTIWEPTALSLQMGSSNINCYGDDDGTATSTVSGGTGGYSYSWFTGESISSLSSLSSGNYYLTVFDANNCSVFDTVNITAPSPITIQISSVDANCGVPDGSISTNVTGGSGGFTYSWSTGATTNSIVNLDAGTYYITVIDASGCEKTSSANIQNSTAPSLNMSATDVTCFGNANGKAKVNVSGGVQPYTYLWDDIDAQTTSEATGLTSGTYTVIVKDAQDCQVSDNTTVNEPDSLELYVVSSDASCGSSDGDATVSAIGGTPGYIYVWSTGETATQITVQAGSYPVTATDNSGCEVYGNAIVNNIGAPVISFTSTDITCNGKNDGTIDITASSGALPYTYNWSSGHTAANLTGLSTGDYTITLEDAVNCKAFEVITISEPEPLLIGSVIADVSCFGKDDGSIVIIASGGDGSYGYNWSTGSTSGNVSGLAPGTYTVTVLDGNNCSGISFISIVEPVELIVNALGTDISCFGELDGSAEASTSGGVGSLTYDWSTSETTQSITDLGKGSYSVMVTDSNGCAKMDLTTIVEPDSMYLQTSSTDESAAGAGDGTATVTPVGGTAPYSYQWSTGENEFSINGLSADVYSVIVTDASGCLSTAAVSIGVGGALGTKTNNLKIDVYPNPSDGLVNIRLNSLNMDDVDIEIFDVIGNKILSANDAKHKDGIIQFDLNNYSEGVYLVKISTSDQVILKKINLINK